MPKRFRYAIIAPMSDSHSSFHPPSLSVLDNDFTEQATALAQQLNLPLASQLDTPTEFTLGWQSHAKKFGDEVPRLCLFPANTGEVSIDFIHGKKNHRRQFGGGKGQPLARAVLLNEAPTILDATAGMGGDAFVFASLGATVQMVERSPIVAALLADALSRAQSNDAPEDIQQIAARLSLVNADAATYLLEQKPNVDVVYLDPMYPEKKKKAATKKDMAALQQLVGPDLDSDALLSAAIQVAKKRVAVKRPKGAPELTGTKATASIQSPNTRYDIYAIKALHEFQK